MIAKIEPASTSLRSQQLAAQAQQMQIQQQAKASQAGGQISPAQSVLALAQSELQTEAPLFDVGFPDADAIQEAQENIGFMMGAMLGRRGAAGQSGTIERPRSRNMLQKLAKQVDDVAPDKIEELRHRIPGVEKIEEIEDLLDSLRRHGFDAGEIALLLAAMLNEKGISDTRRKRLERALDQIMAQDEWALLLFGRLEFGTLTPGALAELRRLYQRAASQNSGLVYWFNQFRQLSDRRRKLKALIRALSFELSAESGITDIRLAAVITDLKRILQFLTLEDHCQRLADRLDIADITGERIGETLLEIIQQSWVYVDWLDGLITGQLPAGQNRYGYARGLMELARLLPETCFEDVEQRETVLSAFVEYQEQLADEEAEADES
ncbi:type III secretion system gatekeeper subunit SctW [Klebsiella michiganensis]|jgi:type III secretion system YopN/LcrE/InvE/MxiC family regulator|uniref:type III secretion system gatekeeper subunit SctW n=1 Tax=Klebsiella michiganensis TaxID=1134687 RepID=UPI00257039B4|nr:type III secretion system gatekeeper subunit SctW [Klebsiella michiganensis]MDL4454943.1 type III secretion system gatekeeper subunit SctW [Klebsiella michiganensis]